MDKFSNTSNNRGKSDIGVINMANIPSTIDKPKTNTAHQKITTFKDLRKKVAIKTAPNHSLRELFNIG